MRLMPMSSSETSLDLFFDPSSAALAEYEMWTAPETGVRVWQNWCRVEIPWDRATAGQCVARLTRTMPRGGIDALGHDQLRFFAAISPGVVARMSVNGVSHDLRGNGEPEQYTVPLGGPRLNSFQLEIVAETAGAGGVTPIWTAFVHSGRDKTRLAPQGRFDESWDGFLVPEGDEPKPDVQIGILFDQDDLPTLRRKARSRLYRTRMEEFHAKVRTMLAVRPESFIGRFACEPLHYTRPMERKGLMSQGALHWLALAGLIDGDAKALRHAARWALSLAHCEYWYNDFAGELPGVRWHHRAFMEAELTIQSALALDWAGSALTPEGRYVVRDAIVRRGLPRIMGDFIDPEMEYTRTMNQGFHFNTGRIFGLIALAREWPRAVVRLPEAEADLWEMCDRTFMTDAGTVEGPAYWQYTVSMLLLGLTALARYRKRAPLGLMPKKMRRLPGYLSVFASTVRPTEALSIGDSRRPAACTAALSAMLAHVFPGEETGRLAGFAIPAAVPGGDLAAALIFGPLKAPKVKALTPEFAVLPKTGQAVISRSLPGVGLVRLQIVGAPGVGGSHSHDDRGNLILEAGGEEVFVDRGIGHYSSPLQLLKYPLAHNLLVPDAPDGSPARQNLAHRKDISPKATYRNGRFHAVIDTSDAWRRPVLRCVRTVVSPSPGEFVITDELDLKQPLAATLHFHTPLRTSLDGDTWVFRGERVVVRLDLEWTPVATRFEREDLGMGKYGPAYGHLQLRSQAAKSHKLVTHVTIRS